jgi:hypothetical protein
LKRKRKRKKRRKPPKNLLLKNQLPKPKVSAEQQVLEEMDLADLKSHIKVNKEHFPNACKGVNFAKDKDALLIKALADLGVGVAEQEAPKEKKPAVKKEKGVSNKSIVWGVFTSSKITAKEQITDAFVEDTASKSTFSTENNRKRVDACLGGW